MDLTTTDHARLIAAQAIADIAIALTREYGPATENGLADYCRTANDALIAEFARIGLPIAGDAATTSV